MVIPPIPTPTPPPTPTLPHSPIPPSILFPTCDPSHPAPMSEFRSRSPASGSNIYWPSRPLMDLVFPEPFALRLGVGLSPSTSVSPETWGSNTSKWVHKKKNWTELHFYNMNKILLQTLGVSSLTVKQLKTDEYFYESFLCGWWITAKSLYL